MIYLKKKFSEIQQEKQYKLNFGYDQNFSSFDNLRFMNYRRFLITEMPVFSAEKY